MSEDRHLVRRVSWRDLAPWLVIFRLFRVAVSLPVLSLALVGALLQPVGWRVAERLFLSPPRSSYDADFERMVSINRRWSEPLIADQHEAPRLTAPRSINDAEDFFLGMRLDALRCYWTFVEPFRRLFSYERSGAEYAYLICGVLWTLLVWSLFGGAITRIAVMRLGREERIGLREAVRDALRYFIKYAASPLFPLLGVAFIVLLLALLGLLMKLDVGVLIGGVLWVLALLASLAMAMLLLGLLFGWPLMWGAVSAEGADAFDALSRSFAYTFQRPLHYLFYALLAAAVGAVGLVVVAGVCLAVEELAWWATSWGMGLERMKFIRQLVEQPTTSDGYLLPVGVFLIRLMVGLLRMAVPAFSYGFFWCAAATIYLLLRKDVDQTELDEVYVENEEETYVLPPIRRDEKGAPVVSRTPEKDPSSSEPSSSSEKEPLPEDPDPNSRSTI